MAPDADQPRTEADFLKYMAGELHEEETAGMLLDPKFWGPHAATLPKDVRGWCARELGRYTLAKGTMDPERKRIIEAFLEAGEASPGGEQRLQELDEIFKALYASLPEGGEFEFLRDWFGRLSKGERGDDGCSGGEEAERGYGESEAQGSTGWEWSESDSEAEQWLFERDVMRAGDAARMEDEFSSAELGRCWEWTEFDSEAEREEATR